ncbi:MAG TPA: DUF4383 domain-containing protein [Acidobacteriota bacterium]|nr:DUF4383 domain-containing protein [Acidobacteriota bacterium]
MQNVGIKLAWVFAASFAAAALFGFIPNPLVGDGALFVTNTAHNLVHLVTAIGFAVVALAGNRASTVFMLAFGVVYTLVGVYGFIALGGASEGHLLGVVHINFMDNFLHLGLGAAIAAGGLASRRSMEGLNIAPQRA